MMKYVFYLLAAVNLFVFVLYGIDKYKAVRQKWRVPEKRLICAAAAFGSAGALLGMLVFRHKIRKPKFYLTVPALLFVHAAILFYLVKAFA